MSENHIATASAIIHAPAARVWAALTDPATIEKYMFGSRASSSWRAGATIAYAGEYEGR